ncbi:hypothetical protein AC578_3493 [Pseudocercospora eumusae]|uniref:Uncharacterized protein n=1 Tax=Pseudocercospora eumusae TaxID=321146 RepID=A0A139HR06_9PEZI|nr:hypothetical protein AC578_3493 [Pseudocercospora eumusae]
MSTSAHTDDGHAERKRCIHTTNPTCSICSENFKLLTSFALFSVIRPLALPINIITTFMTVCLILQALIYISMLLEHLLSSESLHKHEQYSWLFLEAVSEGERYAKVGIVLALYAFVSYWLMCFWASNLGWLGSGCLVMTVAKTVIWCEAALCGVLGLYQLLESSPVFSAESVSTSIIIA